MRKFAKIIEIENHQVLLTIKHDPASDEHKIIIRTDIDEVEAEIQLSFETRENAVLKFNSINENEAKEYLELFRETIKRSKRQGGYVEYSSRRPK